MQDENGSDSGYPVPGTPALFPHPHCRTALLLWMQDTGCTMQDRKGADPGYLVPGTWYLAPVPNSHISNLNKALP